MIRQLAIYLGAIVVGLLTGLFSQAAVAAHAHSGQPVTILAYDWPHFPAVDVDDTSGRGPPMHHPDVRLHEADARGASGPLVRPAKATAYDYDAYPGPALTHRTRSYDRNVHVSGAGAVENVDLSLQPGRVAAKSADELAHLGQGWRATSFGDEAASFEYHFGKHGVEAGVTREQYAQDALNWARNPAGTGKSIQLKDGTEGLRFRTQGGGPGGITDLGGNIITFWYR